jgi:hypothetical protein
MFNSEIKCFFYFAISFIPHHRVNTAESTIAMMMMPTMNAAAVRHRIIRRKQAFLERKAEALDERRIFHALPLDEENYSEDLCSKTCAKR